MEFGGHGYKDSDMVTKENGRPISRGATVGSDVNERAH